MPDEFQIDDDIDYTEQMGDLTLNVVQSKLLRKRKWIPITPDSILKTIWDVIGLIMIAY